MRRLGHAWVVSLVFAAALGCGGSATPVTEITIRLCAIPPADVARLEARLQRPAGFSTDPSDVPSGVTASRDGADLVYGIGSPPGGFLGYQFRLAGDGVVNLRVRALGTQGQELGASANQTLDLPTTPSASIEIAPADRQGDCSACSGAGCGGNDDK